MDYNAAFIMILLLLTKLEMFNRVSGLVGITESEEAQYFIDINDQATTVPKELIWDLADLSPRSSKGTISRIFKRLQQRKTKFFIKMEILQFLEKEIKQGGKDIPNGPKLSFAGLCERFYKIAI